MQFNGNTASSDSVDLAVRIVRFSFHLCISHISEKTSRGFIYDHNHAGESDYANWHCKLFDDQWRWRDNAHACCTAWWEESLFSVCL